jgi:hypothetical protein
VWVPLLLCRKEGFGDYSSCLSLFSWNPVVCKVLNIVLPCWIWGWLFFKNLVTVVGRSYNIGCKTALISSLFEALQSPPLNWARFALELSNTHDVHTQWLESWSLFWITLFMPMYSTSVQTWWYLHICHVTLWQITKHTNITPLATNVHSEIETCEHSPITCIHIGISSKYPPKCDIRECDNKEF